MLRQLININEPGWLSLDHSHVSDCMCCVSCSLSSSASFSAHSCLLALQQSEIRVWTACSRSNCTQQPSFTDLQALGLEHKHLLWHHYILKLLSPLHNPKFLNFLKCFFLSQRSTHTLTLSLSVCWVSGCLLLFSGALRSTARLFLLHTGSALSPAAPGRRLPSSDLSCLGRLAHLHLPSPLHLDLADTQSRLARSLTPSLNPTAGDTALLRWARHSLKADR